MTTFQSTADYSCNVGQQFPSGEDEITRTCEDNGDWSGSTPQCQSKEEVHQASLNVMPLQ